MADVAAFQLDPASSATPQPSASDSTSTSAQTSSKAVHPAAMTAGPTRGMSNGCCNSSIGSCQEQPARDSQDLGNVAALNGCHSQGSWSVCCKDAQPIAPSLSNSTQTQEQADVHPISPPPFKSSQVREQAAGNVPANGLGRSSREEFTAQDQAGTVDAQPLSASQGDTKAVSEGVGSPSSMKAAGLVWELPHGVDAEDCLWLWLGDDDAPALTQLLMTYSR